MSNAFPLKLYDAEAVIETHELATGGVQQVVSYSLRQTFNENDQTHPGIEIGTRMQASS
jgi:hypothetical protein